MEGTLEIDGEAWIDMRCQNLTFNLREQDAMWFLKVDDDFKDVVLSDRENTDDYYFECTVTVVHR